jgi:glutathione synthase/RimK-type ligase-like ATP-grasp enzyme
MPTPSIGLVTADAARSLDPDLEPFAEACRALLGDDRVAIVSWDDPTIDWSRYTDVIIRSTWDYVNRRADFLRWVDHVDDVATLHNPAAIVRWNTDKRYLEVLRENGVAITPTTFVAPGESAPTTEGVHVVKPTVGAGSSGAKRCRPDEVDDHVAVLHAQGQTALVQPYLAGLDEVGETALCFIPSADGSALELSHAFRKEAILRSADVEIVGDLVAKEVISPQLPRGEEVDLARDALSALSVAEHERLTFARVDVAPGPRGPVIMELELIEPSFYFHTAPGSVERFAEHVVDQVSSTFPGRRRTAGDDRPLA